MKFTLLACALPFLFASAAVAQSVQGHIFGLDTLNCRSCPRSTCKSIRQYKRGDVSVVYPFLTFLLINEIYRLFTLSAPRIKTLRITAGMCKCSFSINGVV
jgi:hypothetical protein